MVIGENEKPKAHIVGGGIEENQVQALTIDRMSTNISLIMDTLSLNEAIFSLLLFQDDYPLNHDLNEKIFEGDTKTAREVFENKYLIKKSSKYQRIFPTPFNLDVAEDDRVTIRVYYGRGAIDGSNTVTKSQLNIDIICAKELWVINDKAHKLPLIRPYAIMSRIVEVLGRNGVTLGRIGSPTGFDHLSVNPKFDCLRIYFNTFEVM